MRAEKMASTRIYKKVSYIPLIGYPLGSLGCNITVNI
jgi:hypothetical protein